MFEFPKAEKVLARDIADKIRTNCGHDAEAKAIGLYRYLKGRSLTYGFKEGLEQGYGIRWFHEVKNMWECIEAGNATYVIAEALGLSPRIMTMTNWEGMDTGHETVDVLVNGERILVDPLNSMWGKVEYKKDGIFVADNDVTKRFFLPAQNLMEVSRDIHIARMDYYRSDEGLVNLLCAGQQWNEDRGVGAFIFYDPKKKTFYSRILSFPPFMTPSYMEFRNDPTTEDSSMEVEAGIFASSAWKELKGRSPFVQIDKNNNLDISMPLEPLGEFFLLSSLLYSILIDSSEIKRDGESFLYEDLTLPIRMAEDKRDRLKEQEKEPSLKKRDLHNQYDVAIKGMKKLLKLNPRLLDKATLEINVQYEAAKTGIPSIQMFKNKLYDLGHTPQRLQKEMDALRGGELIHLKEQNPPGKIFPLEEINLIFDRLVKRDLI